MAEVVTFVGYRPPPRYDAKPWTQVRIEEAASDSGAYTLLETVALSPLDADPANPAARSFTTEHGTALNYWYRVVFVDATGDISQPTSPVQNAAGGGPPAAVTPYVSITELQRVLTKPNLTAAETEAMNRVLEAAAREINWDLSYGPDNPPAMPPDPILVDVNLDRAAELWRFNYSTSGVLPVGPESTPIITPRDTWYRHHLRLNPLRTSWGVA